MKFLKLDLQLFASHKGVGSTKNGRDSAGRRLGAKLADGQKATAGSIIYRQRGTRIYPGTNCGMGKDHTLFALVDGIVKYERLGKDKKKLSACVFPGLALVLAKLFLLTSVFIKLLFPTLLLPTIRNSGKLSVGY